MNTFKTVTLAALTGIRSAVHVAQNGDNEVADMTCDDNHEFNMDICQCIASTTCDEVCELPLVKDPITGCGCITISEFTGLYDHNFDENCLPYDADECCAPKKINIFNFYDAVYGDVSGFSTDHVTNYFHHQEEEEEDDGEEDDGEEEDDGDDEEGGETTVIVINPDCPDFDGYV